MGLFSGFFGLPLAPVKGFIALGRGLQDVAEQEQRNPATIRRKLEALDELPEEEQRAEMEELTRQWMASQRQEPGL
jgi:hypothetical protein